MKRTMMALAAVLLTGGMATSAHAGVMGFALLDIEDFTAQIDSDADGDGDTQLDLSDFSSIGLTAQASTSANLGAATDSDTDSAGFSSAGGVFGGGVADPDPAQINVAFANNDFTQHAFPPTPPLDEGVNFTRADALDTGAPITGTGLASDVDATTVAEGELIGDSSGSAGADISVDTFIEFVANFSEDILFDFMATAFVQTFADGEFGDIADADINFRIVVTEDSDGDGIFESTLLDFAPGSLNLSVTSSFLFPGTGTAGSMTAFAVMTPTFAVTAGNTYRVQIEHGSDVQLVNVPLPATLLFLGSGLIGLGILARRRRMTA